MSEVIRVLAVIAVIAYVIGRQLMGEPLRGIMLLGINRLGQAAIVMRHALATGIPFAPEKDGTSFLSGQVSPSGPAASPCPRPSRPPRDGSGQQHSARRRRGRRPGDAGPPGR